MMKRTVYIFTVLCIFFAGEAWGQKYPERKLIRQGNKDYEKGDYSESETDYRKALGYSPHSYEARFNLGNSLYKQSRWEEAQKLYSGLENDSTYLENIAHTNFNAGNSFFQQRKLEEALEEYKNALRKNPNDMEAKFNLAYVKKLLEDEDGDGDGDGNDNQNDDNQDQNDQNDNDQGDDNEDQGNGNDDQQDNGDQDQDQNQDQQPPQPQEQPSGMTKDEAQQLLDAIQQSEDKTREKMDEKKALGIQRSEKNW